MTVPAGKVVPCERKLISWGTVKIISLYRLRHVSIEMFALEENSDGCAYSSPQSCTGFPFFRPRIRSLDASGINEAEARTGPVWHEHQYISV